MKLCKKLRERGISSNGRCYIENMDDACLRRRENILLPCAHAFAKQERGFIDHQNMRLFIIMFRVYFFYLGFDLFLCLFVVVFCFFGFCLVCGCFVFCCLCFVFFMF